MVTTPAVKEKVLFLCYFSLASGQEASGDLVRVARAAGCDFLSR